MKSTGAVIEPFFGVFIHQLLLYFSIVAVKSPLTFRLELTACMVVGFSDNYFGAVF